MKFMSELELKELRKFLTKLEIINQQLYLLMNLMLLQASESWIIVIIEDLLINYYPPWMGNINRFE